MRMNLFVRSIDEIPETPMRETLFAAAGVIHAVVDLSREGGLNDASALVIKTLACEFSGAVVNMYDFVENTAAKQSKPINIDAFNEMYKTVLHSVDNINQIFGKHHSSSDIGHHVQMFNDLMPSFLWVSESDPVSHVGKYSQLSAATGNKLLMTTIRKERPELHASYVSTINVFSAKLNEYIRKNHADGLVWGSGTSLPKHADQMNTMITGEDHKKLSDGFKNLVSVTAAHENLKDLNESIVALVALAAEQDTFLNTARMVPKPADTAKMMEGMVTQLNIISDLCNANIRHKTLGRHFEAVLQASTVFQWVCMDKPIVHCDENVGIFDVFINRIFNEHKNIQNDEGKAHMAWGREIRGAINRIGAIVKSDYNTGPVWASGATAPTKGPGGKSIGGPRGPPPPPPPPPPPASGKKPITTGTCDMSRLFSEIGAKGVEISKMLKHVPDCDKLYKQKDREVRTVNVEELQRKKMAKKGFKQWAPPVGDSVVHCIDDKKWIVEYCGDGDSVERKEVIIENPNMRHAVFINRCNNCIVKIDGKVNSVQIVESLNVQLQLPDTVGPIEVTRSETIEILILNVCPQVIASKVKGLTIHLAGSRDTEMVTSCTTNVNLTYAVVDDDGDKDTVEVSIPEQFKSHISKQNKIATEIVVHGD
eukprot:Tbor_TRINITY_DN3408_c0_g1::TRINITY_DN3408_c0_g1_i1::g.3746::m.3746/K17261/CAP1_2, SRV2; adenylyl cyclase-associated protein